MFRVAGKGFPLARLCSLPMPLAGLLEVATADSVSLVSVLNQVHITRKGTCLDLAFRDYDRGLEAGTQAIISKPGDATVSSLLI